MSIKYLILDAHIRAIQSNSLWLFPLIFAGLFFAYSIRKYEQAEALKGYELLEEKLLTLVDLLGENNVR